MKTLSERLQKRLDAWRNRVIPDKPATIVENSTGRGGQRNHGDVFSKEEWQKEIDKSQTRR